ncbi:MAG: GGDEF domain-containing protein [candidate division Zixibacteria bacterium]|nr:GGDEF domain-containing protein [candidate division Zixibacteria bacterium]
MLSQTYITAALVVLVVVLICLLVFRIRHEKKQLALIRRMNLEEFSAFLKTNSVEGSIQYVAGKVSDLLKDVFECQRIVFLRKQRSFLELNYYHGINKFNRSDFQIRFTQPLADLFRMTFIPQKLHRLKGQIPETVYAKLVDTGFDIFFPIFWRDNLYGVYFIKSNLETKTLSFAVLLASLAQSLSAAYHIKWHESRYDKLERKMVTQPTASVKTTDDNKPSLNILKLVRHRNSETIIPKIISTVIKDTGMEQVVYIYESKLKTDPLNIFKEGITAGFETPDRESFDKILKRLNQNGFLELNHYLRKENINSGLVPGLLRAGLKYMAMFSLSSRQAGLLVWSGGKPPQVIARQLEVIQPHTFDLVENAESYERVEEMSYTDSLTGLANQRYFNKRLNEEIGRAKRYQRSLALIIFDMDDLKKINDSFGHLAGDTILKRLGQILKSSIRAIDIIARYGGDEFCVIMPEADKATCKRFMNRLQVKISASKFKINEFKEELSCTISLGGAIFPDHADDAEKLIFAADMALLKAKDSGRNKFLLYNDPEHALLFQ